MKHPNKITPNVSADVQANPVGTILTTIDIRRYIAKHQTYCDHTDHAEAAARHELQDLRDHGIVEFVRRGRYRVLISTSKEKKMSKPHAAHRTITLKNFLALDAYSGQRDTEKNALKKLRDPKFDPENPTLGHTITTASYMAKICLIDGHTQRWLHEHGHIVLPDELLTTHYYVKSEKELRELYESFDAGIATKTATDQLFSLFHLENIKAKSKFFQSGTGTSAIAFAEGARRGKRGAIDVKLIDMKETIHSWRSEILKLDANIHNVSARVGKNSGILAAQMMTYRKSPVKAAKFWAAFYESKGVGDTSMPWVKLWIQSILDTKGKGGGRETTLMVLEHTLWAFDHSDDDVMLDSAPVTRLGRVHCEIYLPETIREAAKAERQAKAQAKAQATSEANISD